MPFLERVLEPPSYGFVDTNQKFYAPTTKEMFREFASRIHPFNRKNWLPFWCWLTTISLAAPFLVFLFFFFSWPLLAIGLVYSMVGLGTHGTIWLHRYSTHRAFHIKNKFWIFVVRNLVIKLVPEELYVISHHVHHKFSEQAGDPYNVYGGWLYCFLADANHQPIARNLSENDYRRTRHLLAHTGVKLNSYEQYKKWGSIQHPGSTILHQALNWMFWYSAFYLIGGHDLAIAIFGVAVIWAFGIRTFNYDGHGRGVDRRKDGIDFNRKDISINQIWPGYVAGEWHNNHHLYPSSARAGFLPYQLDLAWLFIRSSYALGIVSSYKDSREDFFLNHYRPHQQLSLQRNEPNPS